MSVLCRWLCSTDGCGSWVMVWCALAILWVWVYGFKFMGMGLWVWVHGSAFCGASTLRLAAMIAGSSCIRKETRKLCLGTSQSTSKSWTREALLRWNGIASLAIASQSRMFTTIWRLFTVIPGTDSGWWVLSGVEIGVVGFGWGWEWGKWVVTEVGCCGWGVGLGFDGFCLPSLLEGDFKVNSGFFCQNLEMPILVVMLLLL